MHATTQHQQQQQQQQQCQQCRRVERIDQHVGWCAVRAQYRHLQFERTCIEFRNRTTKGD